MIRVAVVEDSPTTQLVLRLLLEELGFSVTGTARSVAEAEHLLARERPDLVLSDIRLPDGDGIELTRRLLARRGLPIVLITAHDPKNPALIFEALQAGALDVLAKPPGRGTTGYASYCRAFERTLRTLAQVPVVSRRGGPRPAAGLAPPDPSGWTWGLPAAPPIVAIGASTGGPVLVRDLVLALSGRSLAFGVIAQHIMPDFVDGFRTWLEPLAGRPVRLAQAGDRPGAGILYVVPPGSHLRLLPDRTWTLLPARLAPSLLHVPSIDMLFESFASVAARETLAVLLTGMGSDGAAGLRQLKDAGARTIVQRPDTAAVDSMPRRALENAAATDVMTPSQMETLFLGWPSAAVSEPLARRAER